VTALYGAVAPAPDVVILKELLAVPDGTEVEIFIPPAKDGKRKGRGKSSVAQATFGIVPCLTPQSVPTRRYSLKAAVELTLDSEKVSLPWFLRTTALTTSTVASRIYVWARME
jgi:hypothetical protein